MLPGTSVAQPLDTLCQQLIFWSAPFSLFQWASLFPFFLQLFSFFSFLIPFSVCSHSSWPFPYFLFFSSSDSFLAASSSYYFSSLSLSSFLFFLILHFLFLICCYGLQGGIKDFTSWEPRELLKYFAWDNVIPLSGGLTKSIPNWIFIQRTQILKAFNHCSDIQ